MWDSNELSWRDGNLIFRGESLAVAAAEVGRYTPVEFVFVDEGLQKVRVAGFFKAGDVTGFLSNLEANFDITYERVDDQTILLSAHRGAAAIPARATNPRHGGVSKKVLRRLSGRFRHNRAVSDGLDGTMARNAASRKELSAAGLLGIVRRCFEAVADPVARRGGASLADCLMSGLAVYGLKYASLLKFDEAARGDAAVRSNLRRLYGVAQVPSDTRMRERLDEVDPRSLRSCYRRLFAALQRGKGLEGFACLDGHYLLSVDGTGHHSSKKVHCGNCCEKHHRDGTTTYYHMMLGAVLVHPEEREVFPLAPEPIAKTDGSKKNDCERNAAKRLLGDVRREHPHLRLVVVEDALASNGPHIELLGKLDMRFILGAKPGDHAFLFDWVDNTPGTRAAEFAGEDGVRHRFRWLNGAPLNDANFDLEVNFLEYREITPEGKVRHFSWVTDLPVAEDNLMELMRAGRARWRIENETFNTLKNQGYAFGHNFGHGDKHLATVLAHLMMLAFLIDQIQQRCCAVFRRARTRAKRPKYLWEQVRSAFLLVAVPDWETLYAVATKDGAVAVAILDTS